MPCHPASSLSSPRRPRDQPERPYRRNRALPLHDPPARRRAARRRPRGRAPQRAAFHRGAAAEMNNGAAAEVPSPMRVATTRPSPTHAPATAPPIQPLASPRGHDAGQRPGRAERLGVGAVVHPAVEGQQREAVHQLDHDDRWRQQATMVDPEQGEPGGQEHGATDQEHRDVRGGRGRPATRSGPPRARPARPSGRRPPR